MTTSPVETGAVPIVHEIHARFGADSARLQQTRDDIPTLWVSKEKVRDILRHLKTDLEKPYRMLYDLSA
ncbi:MAG: NADH-quinone oxidoreductase subunit C/D, partial [Nitrospiraceae bacterium]